MVKTVRDHYADHLGPVYTWMVGDIDVALSRSAVELDALQLPTKVGGTAVDLGAGFGLHALPLARRGFSVVAMDTCNSLLQELEARKESLPIRAVNADLLAFREHVGSPILWQHFATMCPHPCKASAVSFWSAATRSEY